MIKNTNETPHKGDIVAFQKGEITVVHRIVKETGEGYVTKGDNNDVADPGILQKENITGRAAFSYSAKIRKISSTISTILSIPSTVRCSYGPWKA